MKLIIQYTCPSCLKRYQESQGVEVVNKFAWSKPDKFKDKLCIECDPKELTDTA